MSNMGVDPLNILNHIYLALQSINAREIGPMEAVSLTIGQMSGGTTGNVIPEDAYMVGTLRSFDEKVRGFAKKRILEISRGIAKTLRGEATVTFFRCSPALRTDASLVGEVLGYTRELLGEERVLDIGSKTMLGMGSEDFAYIAERVPAILVCLSAGARDTGYKYPIHHPKALFDEDVLPVGAAVYASSAVRWLIDNC